MIFIILIVALQSAGGGLRRKERIGNTEPAYRNRSLIEYQLKTNKRWCTSTSSLASCFLSRSAKQRSFLFVRLTNLISRISNRIVPNHLFNFDTVCMQLSSSKYCLLQSFQLSVDIITDTRGNSKAIIIIMRPYHNQTKNVI